MKDPQHPHWVRVIADDPRLPYKPEAIARAFPPVVRGSKTGGKADTDGSPIPEGGRNAHLASLAGTMRRRGMTPGAILAALMAENEARCRPPLYSDEVERIAASVSRYAPGQGDTGGTPQGDGAALGAGHAVPFLKLVSMDSLMVRRPPLRYAIDGYLPRQLVTLLGAHGGLGKSYLALAFAAHVACGRDFSGRAAYCGRALYVSLEDDEDMVLDRMRRIVLAYGLDPEAVKANVTIVTGTHGDCAMAVEGGYSKRLTATKVMDEVKAAAAGYSLVVIDNASDGFAGNENDRSQVRGFMRMLADIGRSSGAAVLLLAHIDKAAARYGSQNNSYSGSTAWHNSARSRLALTSDDKSEVIELVQEKLNVGRKAPPLLMTWTDDAVLVPGTLPGAPGGREATERSTQDADAVLGALRAAEAVSVNVPPGRQGSSTAFRVLETFDELPTSLRGAKGKDRFWAAMNLLLARGIVVVEPYKSHDRKDRQRLRLFTGRAYSEPASTGTCADTAAPRQSPIPPSDIGAGARQYAGCGIGADMAQMGAKAQPSKTVRTNDTTDDEAEAF